MSVILAMTANVLKSDIKQCFDVGMDGHIAKPIDETTVVEKILEQLEG